MKQYLELLQDVLENGTKKEDRTGTGTLSVFGRQLRFDLSKGFPAVTTKKLFWKGVVGELLWFISGSTNVKNLQAMGVNFWNPWAREDGDLGPVYGKQWRNWISSNGESIDQIAEVIQGIKKNPHGRRHIVSAWNVGELEDMALPPCHLLFQFYVEPGKTCKVCRSGSWISEKGFPVSTTFPDKESYHACEPTGKTKPRLSCQLYQRSADLLLGVPVNIASYALLTHMIAQVCDLDVGEFVHTFGDAHIYTNHIDQVKEQLQRFQFPLPNLRLNPEVKDIDAFTMDDIILENYQHHPAIRGKVAV